MATIVISIFLFPSVVDGYIELFEHIMVKLAYFYVPYLNTKTERLETQKGIIWQCTINFCSQVQPFDTKTGLTGFKEKKA